MRQTGRMVSRLSALVLTLALLACPAAAQQKTFNDPLVDHLAGTWVLRGTIAGKQIVHDVTAKWVLAHQYLEVHEVSRETNPGGSPQYQAMVLIGWDEGKHIYDCVWLDDYGNISTQSLGYAPPDGNRIAFVFHIRDDPGAFHTTFTFDPKANSWAMDMDTETGGKLTPFARTVLTAP
jgi:hypothetical protein